MKLSLNHVCIVFFTLACLSYLYTWRSPNRKVSGGQLLCAALAAAQAGGRWVKTVREQAPLNEKRKGETKEGVLDMVTDGDLKSHQAMMAVLSESFPGVKVVSEEHDTTLPEQAEAADLECSARQQLLEEVMLDESDLTVWIDPLDATKEYTEHLLQYVTTMVCVAVQGKPTIGVIHEPFTGVTYWGWSNNGVSQQLSSKNPSADKDSFIVSMSHTGKVEERIKSKFPDAKIVKAGGAGYKSIQVANGKVGAYVHVTDIKKWDVCAGHAILSSVGGNVVKLNNQEISYEADGHHVIEGGLLASLDTQTYSTLLY